MQSNRSRDTAPEIAVRSALHRRGLRFRKHVRPVPGLACTVDVVFPTERLALFIDGCYWHSCPEHATAPITNSEWWHAKLTATRERDERNTKALTEAGWQVVRVWEHEDPSFVADKIAQTVEGLRLEGVRNSARRSDPSRFVQTSPTARPENTLASTRRI